MSELIPLHRLSMGHSACVEHVTGETAVVHRLKELGFRDGAVVEMVRTGGTCIVRLDGRKLGFRADDAVNVFVRRPMPLGAAG